MSDIAIRAEDLSKRFLIQRDRRTSLKERLVRGRSTRAEEFWALRDASFEVPRGETFGLVGHNGSGKSTALKVLAGIYRPTSGRVQVAGRVSALLELGAGFHPELTGRENIRLNGSILGMSPRQIDGITDEIIEFSGVEPFIDSPVKVYSSGMFMRLGFAIAVKLDPEILIVDEIIAVGDEEFQRKCFDYMYELRKGGTTTVLVSHGLHNIERMCESAAWLEQGRIRRVGTAGEIVTAYLDEVNRKEAGVAADASPQSVVIGSGNVSLESLEYLDSDDHPVAELISGTRATIRMNYLAREDVDEAIVGVGIYAPQGLLMTAPASHRHSDPIRIRKGAGRFDFVMPEVLLNPGTYEVSTLLGIQGHWFDVRPRAFTLTVRGRGDTEAGLMSQPGIWHHQPAGAPAVTTSNRS